MDSLEYQNILQTFCNCKLQEIEIIEETQLKKGKSGYLSTTKKAAIDQIVSQALQHKKIPQSLKKKAIKKLDELRTYQAPAEYLLRIRTEGEWDLLDRHCMEEILLGLEEGNKEYLEQFNTYKGALNPIIFLYFSKGSTQNYLGKAKQIFLSMIGKGVIENPSIAILNKEVFNILYEVYETIKVTKSEGENLAFLHSFLSSIGIHPLTRQTLEELQTQLHFLHFALKADSHFLSFLNTMPKAERRAQLSYHCTYSFSFTENICSKQPSRETLRTLLLIPPPVDIEFKQLCEKFEQNRDELEKASYIISTMIQYGLLDDNVRLKVMRKLSEDKDTPSSILNMPMDDIEQTCKIFALLFSSGHIEMRFFSIFDIAKSLNRFTDTFIHELQKTEELYRYFAVASLPVLHSTVPNALLSDILRECKPDLSLFGDFNLQNIVFKKRFISLLIKKIYRQLEIKELFAQFKLTFLMNEVLDGNFIHGESLYDIFKKICDLSEEQRSIIIKYSNRLNPSNLINFLNVLEKLPLERWDVHLSTYFSFFENFDKHFFLSLTFSEITPDEKTSLLAIINGSTISKHTQSIFLKNLFLIPRELWIAEAERYIQFSHNDINNTMDFLKNLVFKPGSQELREEYLAHFQSLLNSRDIDFLNEATNALILLLEIIPQDSVLGQKIIQIYTITHPAKEGALNPYTVFTKILTDQKRDIAVRIPYSEIGDSLYIRLDLTHIEDQIDKMLKRRMSYEQLEAVCGVLETKESMIDLFNAIKEREGRSSEQIAQALGSLPNGLQLKRADLARLEMDLLEDRDIADWMSLPHGPKSRVSAEILHLNMCLHHIRSLPNTISPGEVFSEREAAFLRFLDSIEKCEGGKKEQLAALYRLTPHPINKTPAEWLIDHIYDFYAINLRTFFMGNLFQTLTGLKTKANVHECDFIQNCIGRRLGIPNGPVFDTATDSITDNLLSKSSDIILQTALRHLPLEEIIEKIKKDLIENCTGTLSQYTTQGIVALFNPEDGPQYYPGLYAGLNLDESDEEMINMKGTLQLLVNIGILSQPIESRVKLPPFQGVSRGIINA